jgi:hypothetical protein
LENDRDKLARYAGRARRPFPETRREQSLQLWIDAHRDRARVGFNPADTIAAWSVARALAITLRLKRSALPDGE